MFDCDWCQQSWSHCNAYQTQYNQEELTIIDYTYTCVVERWLDDSRQVCCWSSLNMEEEQRTNRQGVLWSQLFRRNLFLLSNWRCFCLWDYWICSWYALFLIFICCCKHFNDYYFGYAVCDDTCKDVVLDPENELLVCTISGHCFDRLLSPSETGDMVSWP